MQRDELGHWLRLSLTPGVGNCAARQLLAAFGLPQSVFEQSQAALRQVVSSSQAIALQSVPAGWEALLDTTWAWLERAGIEHAGETAGICRQVWTLGDAAYPASLLQIEDPPLLLYAMGAGRECAAHMPPAQQCIAIVGSRNPTPQGQTNARQFASALAEAGLTVVSGLALGVDGAAHEGALDSAASIATIAVVGTGLDRVYPKKHLDLAHRIAKRGWLLSEYPLGTPALAANFPKRNRLIAGLTRGTLVVEAALQSGSLITARLAAEQGKEVFAIPGSIHSPQSRGCHALLKQGAKLVESAQDVLEEFAWAGAGFSAANTTDSIAGTAQNASAEEQYEQENSTSNSAEKYLLERLGYDPVGIDALIARTGMGTADLQVQLLNLELAGHVARLPGGVFQRMAQV